ncbi:hypothetical protein ICM05_04025 [Leucobacter sp. cx-42]|uniref:hypothetical protein n=1 Tax=unclassified Leucobacter TaxID=2621730 RepID=UPI00165D6C76|nr:MULTISPECIES: hypothetical protein [unclassified Leucobacter]MBC9953816.1 hypothetical protein [Leucobacter sp. cx-42]
MNHTIAEKGRAGFLVPNVAKQSWYFIVGGSLFALGSAASIWGFAGANFTNWVCFVGAWFFTTAGLFQLVLSGDATKNTGHGKALRAEWLAAATQTFGTLLFNVSTTSALTAASVDSEKRFVWNPDAGGSVAFLVSAFLVYVAFYRAEATVWAPTNPGWWAAHINMIGCIAFAFSAVGAFVLDDGTTKDSPLANWGTFIGAICFVAASAVALPGMPWNRGTANLRRS